MYYLHHTIYIFQFLLAIVLGAFSRTVEVFVRRDFGHRYLLWKFGYFSVPLMATFILLSGVVLHAPANVAKAIAAVESSKAEFENEIGFTGESLQERTERLIDKSKNSFWLDELVIYVTRLTRTLYREGLNCLSVPFLSFLFSFLGLYAWNAHSAIARRDARERTEAKSDSPGISYLNDWFPDLDESILMRVVEPGLVVILAFLVWGRIPGSSLVFPSLNVDPVLGHYLLVAGVMFAVKENLKYGADRDRTEKLNEQHAESGVASGRIELTTEDFYVALLVAAPAEPVSAKSAFRKLDPGLRKMLSGIPQEMAGTTPSNEASSVPREKHVTGNKPNTQQRAARQVVCPKCRAGYTLTCRVDRFRCGFCKASLVIRW